MPKPKKSPPKKQVKPKKTEKKVLVQTPKDLIIAQLSAQVRNPEKFYYTIELFAKNYLLAEQLDQKLINAVESGIAPDLEWIQLKKIVDEKLLTLIKKLGISPWDEYTFTRDIGLAEKSKTMAGYGGSSENTLNTALAQLMGES